MDIFTIILWVITLIWFVISLIKGKDKTIESIKKSKGMMGSMLPQILGILFLIGLILTLMPPDTIKNYLGGSNPLMATIVAALVGSITLIPAFVAFPLVGSMVDMGASIMPAVAFLTTLTMVGFVTFNLERKEFGTKFALSRNLLSFGFAIVIAMFVGGGIMITRIKNNPFLFSILGAYIVLFIVNTEKAILAITNTAYYLKEMIIIMPVVFLLTALIDAWIPKDLIMKTLGEESGLKGALISLGLGSVSAGPIYAAFPVAKTLLKKGASISNIVVILSAWAVIKIPMLANEAKFLSPKFMITRWIFTTIGIITMGYIVSKIVKREDIPLEEDILDKGEIKINKEVCIGCGICAEIAEEYFRMENKKAVVIKDIEKEQKEKPIEAMKRCPVNAIDIGHIEKLK